MSAIIPNGASEKHKVLDVVETDSGLKRLADTYYVSFLSQNAKERKLSPIRSLLPLEKTPGIISLLAGKPNPTMFPITSLSFTARSPHSSSPTDEVSYSLTGDELAQGLQYGDTAGIEPLKDWLYGLQEYSHGRKRGEGWSIHVGSGSQDMIYKAVQVLVDDGDPVLIESPVYAYVSPSTSSVLTKSRPGFPLNSGVIPMFQTLHCELLEIETDAEGISTSSLRAKLENWPYGCNPTGMTATLERRVEALKIAREHDLIILEDDPYYYLYYGTAPRPPSYFSLEKEVLPETGRVLRFDSFSKILSAGIRVGFASGPEALLKSIERHTATLNLQTPTFTQFIVYRILDSWGYDGFKVHTGRVSAFYREKRDVFQAAMEKYLAGYAEWVKPEAGMFFWFKLNLNSNVSDEDGGDSEFAIRTTAFENGVLALPGKVFLPNGNKTAYVRASFSLSPPEDVYEALKRLATAIAQVRAKQA
ncbi:Kynurenine/alpha-aminoadipate aminotransferase, mitochondrial [Leucoagaricus sp. SymC.cos]|nr:Kynurenine/alpha-aminoadipate aminotransferase, mitochondrial [Leucoagaricus sp. SymC.cos]